ncbi:MAG TPA: hypothetical protein VG873_16795 [Burkholderiales bacterium]|nr:hypothetical protein [Burkholderiales bacterium]
MRLRSSLFLLVLATAIPLVLSALVITVVLLQHDYDNFVQVAKDRNRAFMTAIDTEVNNSISTLQAVAASRSLGADDLEGFHKTLIATLATQPNWLNLQLFTPDGRQVVNASAPWGVALPDKALEPSTLQRVLETKQPSVGGVIAGGPFEKRYGIVTRVPVLREGKVAYVLTALVKPESFLPLSSSNAFPRAG